MFLHYYDFDTDVQKINLTGHGWHLFYANAASMDFMKMHVIVKDEQTILT
jgi:hypothetical protein